MNIDFHSHVKLSKKTPFMTEYFQEMMREAQASGLTALALTEHFNTIRFMDIYDYLDEQFPYEHGYYNINGLKLFPGMEVDIKEVGHILLIGSRDDILAIHHALEDYSDPDQFISFEHLLDLAEQYQLLKIGAHPYRESTPLHHLPLEQLQRLDAFDLNGKDLYSHDAELYREKLEAFAEEVGLPIVGGSDTHQFLQYGCIINQFSQECNTVEDLLTCINAGAYQIQVSNDLPLKVKSAKLVKKYLKKLHQLEEQTVQ